MSTKVALSIICQTSSSSSEDDKSVSELSVGRIVFATSLFRPTSDTAAGIWRKSAFFVSPSLFPGGLFRQRLFCLAESAPNIFPPNPTSSVRLTGSKGVSSTWKKRGNWERLSYNPDRTYLNFATPKSVNRHIGTALKLYMDWFWGSRIAICLIRTEVITPESPAFALRRLVGGNKNVGYFSGNFALICHL